MTLKNESQTVVNVDLFPVKNSDLCNNDPYIGIVGVILGAFLASWFAYKFSLIGITKQEKLSAAKYFRLHYIELLRKLDMETDKDPTEILKTSYEKCLEAKLEYQIHLNEKQSTSLELNWRKLYYNQQANVIFLEQYTSAGQSVTKGKELRRLATERIQSLIETAFKLRK